jgi:predicted transcriptional regulator YdeE
MMQPEIFALDAMYIVGTEIRTQNRLEAKRGSARIPAHWDNFYNQHIVRRIPNRTGEDIYGIYTHYANGHKGEYSHIIGIEVAGLLNIPEGMVGLMIPEGEYMVFTAEGEMPEAVADVWEDIRAYFEENTIYQRAYTYDFEVYDPSEPEIVNIYVSIR